MISDEKFQEIIDKTDMVSLVSEYVELTKKGSGYFGLCPFHNDSSPSFSVSPEKKIAKCMSCGEGGNPINFLRKIKNISLIEAASILAQRASIDLDVNIKPKKEDKNKKFYDIYKVAQEFYSYYLFNSVTGKKALEYLYKRGLTEDTIKEFKIGLAPSEKDTLKNVLIDKGFLDLDCIEIGLIKNNGTTLYDIFINRIVFPITNENGQTIAFSGRLYDGSNGPKYVNTMETIIYRKGDHLYNLSNALKQINRTKRIILCEGQMDTIKISNANLTDVVCALGSALTANQVKLIKKYATHVVLAYDNDAAGIKATKTAISLLNGLTIDVLQLPSGIDPDEYISQNSIEKFNELFEQKINSIEFIYKTFFIDKNLYSLVDVEDIKNDVFKYIKTIKSNTIQEKLFNKLSDDLKINYNSLLKDYNNQNNIKPTNFQQKPQKQYNESFANNYIPEPPPMDFGAPPIYEDNFTKKHDVVVVENKTLNNNKGLIDACMCLIALLIKNKENLNKMNELLKGKDLSVYIPEEYEEIFMHILYLHDNLNFNTPLDLIRKVNEDGLYDDKFKKIVEVMNAFKPKLNEDKILKDSIHFIEKQYLRKLENIGPADSSDQLKTLNEKLANKIKIHELEKNKN